MKIWFSAFTMMLLLTGCTRHGDAAVRTILPGTWTVTGDSSELGHFKSMITVDRSGDYVSQVIFQGQWDGVTRTSNLAGTFEVRDGILIDTMRKHSNTNAVLPRISRAHIVRFDERELVLKEEANNQQDVPTNEVGFRKVGDGG
jgi:hypothetical protein